MNVEDVWKCLEAVTDPEVPVLSILDMGIVRSVEVIPGSVPGCRIVITPTYSGCPAMDVIGMTIRMALSALGFRTIDIVQQLSPAWTTDWMTETGKARLREYGIAPPQTRSQTGLFEDEAVPCPRCGARETRLVSRFGATACKALYQCTHCLEPFEYFKCH